MNDAVPVFARHLDLATLRGRRRGLVRCPFHPDKSPSLSVDLDRALFHCFACGVGGGERRFAELIGDREPVTSARPPRHPSPLEDARARMLAEVRRQRERAAPYRDLMAIGDFIRRRLRFADEARRAAIVVGPIEPAWELLAQAARLEAEALAVEAQVDEILAGGRIA